MFSNKSNEVSLLSVILTNQEKLQSKIENMSEELNEYSKTSSLHLEKIKADVQKDISSLKSYTEHLEKKIDNLEKVSISLDRLVDQVQRNTLLLQDYEKTVEEKQETQNFIKKKIFEDFYAILRTIIIAGFVLLLGADIISKFYYPLDPNKNPDNQSKTSYKFNAVSIS